MTQKEKNAQIKQDILSKARDSKSAAKKKEEADSDKEGSENGFLKRALDKNHKKAGLKD